MFAHIRVLIMALMTAGPAFAQTPAAAPDKPVKMVVLGDSLSAGLGLPASAAFPAKCVYGAELRKLAGKAPPITDAEAPQPPKPPEDVLGLF